MSVTISGSGQIIKQVVQTVKTNAFSVAGSSGTYYPVTGLSVSITPTNASNKVLVLAYFQTTSSTGYRNAFTIQRNGSNILLGDAAGSRIRATSSTFQDNTGANTNSAGFSYMDSPATTSAVTYQIAVTGEGSFTCYVNRSYNDADNTSYFRGAATIIAMEVAYA